MPFHYGGKDAGHTCSWQAEADTREELRTKVAEHVTTVHNVQPVTDTVMNELDKAIRET